MKMKSKVCFDHIAPYMKIFVFVSYKKMMMLASVFVSHYCNIIQDISAGRYCQQNLFKKNSFSLKCKCLGSKTTKERKPNVQLDKIIIYPLNSFVNLSSILHKTHAKLNFTFSCSTICRMSHKEGCVLIISKSAPTRMEVKSSNQYSCCRAG